MDFSFLKLYDEINGYQSDNYYKDTEFLYSTNIQLSPDETYLQTTNFPDGLSLSSNFTASVIDCFGNELLDITPNVFVDEFIDSNGNTQSKIEYVNIGRDFYGKAVQIKLFREVSNTSYYTKPILITNNRLEKTFRFDYTNELNLFGISYESADCTQSIRLNLQFTGNTNESDVGSYYQISSSRNISTRLLKKISRNYIIENCDTFLLERMQKLFEHDTIYIDNERITNNPIIEPSERLGRSNMDKATFNAYVDSLDRFVFEYQIFEGLVLESVLPFGTYTQAVIEAEGKATFNLELTLNTGTLTLFDASDNSVIDTFTQDQMLVDANELVISTLNADELANGTYYIHFTQGLVSGLGVSNEAVNDSTTWRFELTDSQYNELEYESTEYLT